MLRPSLQCEIESVMPKENIDAEARKLEIGRGPEIQRAEESWIQTVEQAEPEGRSRDGNGKLRILSDGDRKSRLRLRICHVGKSINKSAANRYLGGDPK